MSSADVAAVLSRAGVNRPDLASWIDDPVLDETLDRATNAAAERGVFGAPTIFIGDDMYFGNDRLHFVRERLARQAVA
jgi:2-hydroxychromene-2-carboxylate isomerase